MSLKRIIIDSSEQVNEPEMYYYNFKIVLVGWLGVGSLSASNLVFNVTLALRKV